MHQRQAYIGALSCSFNVPHARADLMPPSNIEN
ncbi:hypothetical protein T05_761 [Trichinella murrelli]|uniref:Uncharacterized protein n=1 Tax=Trichinella murrelli TaxID=144512 RepID=A0A0V0SSR2_9BILA|nr:hypothetical protein T05_761 [Trichinella murrelli]